MQLFESTYCRGEELFGFGDWFSWFPGRQLANKRLCTPQNFAASNFCWIWFILKHPCSRLLFTFGLIREFLPTIHNLPRCHRRVSKHRSRIFGAYFFQPIDMNLFLSNWQIVWDPTRKYWRSNWQTWQSCISVDTQHQWFRQQQLIMDDLHGIVCVWLRLVLLYHR